ncbi:hypothetical protein TrVE_jg10157 [Triparma verrucosa]|uniref:Uncharacterized protein n=1 Tax=Triparma verrucosa TaxID=1606542 RepID=A0A9W7EQJ2_9STRA|nr:hypothetical protein TrVE_jg10157 [Triparma verrucosa]
MTFDTPNIPLTLATSPEYSLGAHTIICVDVMWGQGEQSFCKNELADWVLRGLESGDYAVRVTLHSVDPSKREMVALTPDGHIDPNDIVVVETAYRHFTVDLGDASIPPKFQITWPRNKERVVMPSDGGVEVSFRVTPPIEKGLDVVFEGNVCLTWGGVEDLSGASFVCGDAGSSVLALPNVKAGRNAVTGVLVDTTGKIISDEHATSSNAFFVEEIADSSGLVLEVGREGGDSFVYNSDYCGGKDETINVVVISARTIDRYEEAMTMLKSLLFNWNRGGVGGRFKYIKFHLVLDEGGVKFFKEALLAQDIANVCYEIYNFEQVCGVGTTTFLEDYGFELSAHYSGKAGYCRLFLSPVINANDFIAIESDQLFFEDVNLLFEEFADMPESVLVAAPEMYQHWYRGRPYNGDNDGGRMDINGNNNADDGGGVGLEQGDDWHGYGYIGGIMAFRSSKMKEQGWENFWRSALKSYIESSSEESWAPRLNDQDVFNAVFTVEPKLAGNFDCSWNLQYHAYMNTARICAEGELNCEESRRQNIFVCRKRPRVVHFMAGSYKSGGLYYSAFWDSFKKMDLGLIKLGLGLGLGTER